MEGNLENSVAVVASCLSQVKFCGMNVRECFLLWLVSIPRLCSASQYASDHFNYSTFVDVTQALHEDVKYMSERIEQVNADAVFGLTLAQANLVATLASRNTKFIFENEWNRLVQIEKLCNNTRISARDKFFQRRNTPLNKLIRVLTSPEIWIGKIPWRGELLPAPSPDPDLTNAKATALIFFGSPQEYESDYCLMQLVENNCQITKDCADMLIRKDGSRGYPLTHRLLFTKIATALNCEQNSRTNLTALKDEYCQKILQDIIDLEAVYFPGVSRDLAMEQIVLCGMEGYSEFTNGHYADFVTSWQNPYGCFSGSNISQRQKKIRRKKSTNPMDYGCDSHASGVAAATLSVLIRRYVENDLSPTHKSNNHN